VSTGDLVFGLDVADLIYTSGWDRYADAYAEVRVDAMHVDFYPTPRHRYSSTDNGVFWLGVMHKKLPPTSTYTNSF
jgi:hypothetical protein